MLLKAKAPPSVGGTTVPPGTVLPLSSTFQIAAVSTAAPFPFASGFTWASTVHRPAGKVIPPAASATQPVHDAGIEGTAPVTGVDENELARLTPGTNAAQPVALSATRLSACGSRVPVVAELVSTYGVTDAVPSRMYVAVFVPLMILA